ncbi:putative inner membrane protein [Poriferisphaera corsica]|uniref:Putative inner membrane protein n=1 Tax=Poriferisphaera corsica TaxID=2528020 RepID=A0A517YQL9_9BACT|nr:YeeE/YedE thiosulfate transporter family protein [Poriferisphaera corsica]QDU32523.1 putative inner membrane protein [Poriferisphaera corsica]
MFTITSPFLIIAGLATGLVFGFLLQKAHVTRYHTILNQFLFRDYTVLKVMLTAIITGAVGIWGMRSLGLDFPMHVKSAALAANIVGGLIFGIGMALLGFCPGTGMAALGDGSRDIYPGILGMIVGGGIYAELYPSISANFLKALGITAEIAGKTTTKVTLVDLTQISPWYFILALIIIALAVFTLIEKVLEPKTQKHSNPPTTQAATTTT